MILKQFLVTPVVIQFAYSRSRSVHRCDTQTHTRVCSGIAADNARARGDIMRDERKKGTVTIAIEMRII